MGRMLAGFECARRRRFHRSGSFSDHSPICSRRSLFCLFATGHEKHLNSSASIIRNMPSKGMHEEMLSPVAREAKERLDARLKTIGRNNSSKANQQQQQIIHLQGNYAQAQQKDEVRYNCYNVVKKSSSSKAKKVSEQAECAVCLEEFKAADIPFYLPCGHRFHSDCVVPWLESSSHCPCCRTTVFSK